RHLVVLTCYLSDDLPTPQICTPSLHDALPICRCEAPIIVVSANAFADDRERSVAARFNDFLAKPVHIPMLLEKIRQHLQVTWIKDRKSTRLNSSHVKISYAVFCLKKKR